MVNGLINKFFTHFKTVIKSNNSNSKAYEKKSHLSLGFGLLKTGIYEYSEMSGGTVGLYEMRFRLKKALNLISRYHKLNRKILFYGVPIMYMNKSMLKLSNHYFIPESAWSRGLLTNIKHVKRKIKTQKIDSSIASYLSKYIKIRKVSLVVVFSIEHNFEVIRECYKRRLPLVTFRVQKIPFTLGFWDYSNYKVVGKFDFFDIEVSYFVQLMLSSLLRRR